MKYLLDTNAVIQYVNGRSDQLAERLLLAGDDQIAVSSITRAELSYGLAKSNRKEQTRVLHETFLNRFGRIDFDWAAAALLGEQRYQLERTGQPIGIYDLLIACIALANDLILVTHNTREFRRVDGLRLEDWEI